MHASYLTQSIGVIDRLDVHVSRAAAATTAESYTTIHVFVVDVFCVTVRRLSRIDVKERETQIASRFLLIRDGSAIECADCPDQIPTHNEAFAVKKHCGESYEKTGMSLLVWTVILI